MRVIIVGAGGHGQVVADALLASARLGSGLEPVGYVDDNAALTGSVFLGLEVVGRVDALTQIPHDAVVVAIGDNATRRSLFNALAKQNERFVIARHPSAIVADSVTVGAGTMICAGAIINPGSIIGSNVILNTGCSIDHHNHIGDHVHIGPGVRTGGEVSVATGALVGIGAIVMPGRAIGAESTVGAGAVVQQDVAEAAVVAGVPARPLRLSEFKKRRA